MGFEQKMVHIGLHFFFGIYEMGPLYKAALLIHGEGCKLVQRG